MGHCANIKTTRGDYQEKIIELGEEMCHPKKQKDYIKDVGEELSRLRRGVEKEQICNNQRDEKLKNQNMSQK